MNDDSNMLSSSDYSDADIEFREVQDGDSVRGKITNRTNTPEDINCLRRLENSVSNLESCMGTFRLNQGVARSRSLIFNVPSCTSPSKDDTLSDVDLEKFEQQKPPVRGTLRAFSNEEPDTTTSLSDFHNVGEVILSIRHRLESFLKTNRENSIDQTTNTSSKQTLEENIVALKIELESYLQFINDKTEQDLRRFSENMLNEQRMLRMKKAFIRKEKLQTNFYETLGSKNYAIANNDSTASTLNHNRDTVRVRSGFTLRNCYDNDYVFEDFSENSSVEFYTMLINEEPSDEFLNDAPTRPPQINTIGFSPRERISLIFRDPEEVIKQWQNYQLHTLKVKHKRKPSRAKLKSKSVSHDALWGFTLSSHQNQTLQLKLKREQQTRYF